MLNWQGQPSERSHQDAGSEEFFPLPEDDWHIGHLLVTILSEETEELHLRHRVSRRPMILRNPNPITTGKKELDSVQSLNPY